MQLYGTLAGQEALQPGRRGGLGVARVAVGTAVLALLVVVGVAAQLHSAQPAALAGKDLNTYADWLKTLNGPASYTGIGDETSDFGASQGNSKKGMRELVPGALPASADIAKMQGADFVDDVVRASRSRARVRHTRDTCRAPRAARHLHAVRRALRCRGVVSGVPAAGDPVRRGRAADPSCAGGSTRRTPLAPARDRPSTTCPRSSRFSKRPWSRRKLSTKS
jgi:hypothetical protein